MGFFKRLFGGKDEQPAATEEAAPGQGQPPKGIVSQLEAARQAAHAEAVREARLRAQHAHELSTPGPLAASDITYSSDAAPIDARFVLEPEHFVIDCPGPDGGRETYRFPFDALALVAAGKGTLRVDLHVPAPVYVGPGRLALRSLFGKITEQLASLRWENLARRHFLVAAKCPYCFQSGIEVDPLRHGVPHPEENGKPKTTAVCHACRSNFVYDYAAGKFVLVEVGN